MPKGIIDLLKAVQIQKQDRSVAPLPPRKGDRLADAVIQQLSIGQPGEKIMLGRMELAPLPMPVLS